MYSERTAWSFASIVLFILVLIVVSYHGSRSRVFAHGAINLSIDSPQQAFTVWQEKGVKGRILLLFDRYPHFSGLFSYDGPPQLTPSNLIEYAILKNIIRKIYLIVPDDTWEEFRRTEAIRPLRRVPGLSRGLYLGGLSGVPVIAVTPSSLTHLEEKPLVYINSRLFDEARTGLLLSEKKILSDIIISLRDATQ